MDEVAVVRREQRRAPSGTLRQTVRLAVLVSHEDTLVGRAIDMSGIEHVAAPLVIAIDIGDVVFTLLHLTLQLSADGVKIEMHESRAVAGQEDVSVGQLDVLHHLLLHILRHALLENELADG